MESQKLLQLFRLPWKIISYVYSPNLERKLKKRWYQIIYSGWVSREFKSFAGMITGPIDINGGKFITVKEGALIQERVRLLAWEEYEPTHQKFTPEIIIGKNAIIQKDCFLSAINKIEIGENVAVTEHTVILDNVHGDFQDNHLTFNENPEIPDVFLTKIVDRELASKGPVVIENDVHIGMFCTILPNTHIGHHSVIAAHSTVQGKIPPYSLVGGNPGRVILTFGRKKRKS